MTTYPAYRNELYPGDDAPGSIDLGDEFENPFQPWAKHVRLSNVTDMICGLVASSSAVSGPRPAITAWEGADLDAYWYDAGTWLHCQTGEVWHA